MDPYVQWVFETYKTDQEKITRLHENVLLTTQPVNLLAGTDPTTIFILKTIIAQDGSTAESFTVNGAREFCVDMADACCEECVRARHFGQKSWRECPWALVMSWWNEYSEGRWYDPGGEILCPDGHNSKFKTLATLLTPELRVRISRITLTICRRQFSDMATLCSALQNIRRYIPNPQAITINYQCSCVENASQWKCPTIKHTRGRPSKDTFIAFGPLDTGIGHEGPPPLKPAKLKSESSVEKTQREDSIDSILMPGIHRGAITVNPPDFADHTAKEADALEEIVEEKARGPVEIRFQSPTPPKQLPTESTGRKQRSSASGTEMYGIGSHDTVKRRRVLKEKTLVRENMRGIAPNPPVILACPPMSTWSIDSVGRTKSKLDTIQTDPISEKTPSHHQAGQSQNISTHDFATETKPKLPEPSRQESIDCPTWPRNFLSLLLNIWYQFVAYFDRLRKKFVTWIVAQAFLGRWFGPEVELRWKVKFMMWRLEAHLPPGKRIVHLPKWENNDLWWNYREDLWHDGGRRWWE